MADGSTKLEMTSSARRTALLGAMFLMATSAIGPGFITQTTVFTVTIGYPGTTKKDTIRTITVTRPAVGS